MKIPMNCMSDAELELFIEYPVRAGSEEFFVSFSDSASLVGYLRGDTAMLALFERVAVASGVKRGLPLDVSDAVEEAFRVSESEIVDEPCCVTKTEWDELVGERGLDSEEMNPLLRCALSSLSILSEAYGDRCRFVFWTHEV